MTCQTIGSLAEISDRYDAILCDLWGCYHDGLTPYAAAVEACRAFRAQGGLVVLLTNAPRPAASVQSFLDKIGGPRDSYDAIVSSGGACRAAIRSGSFGTKIHYVGPGRDLHMLEDLGIRSAPFEQAQAILITGLRDDSVETPDDYRGEIAEWRARALPVLCANPDIQVDRGNERLWCAGAIAQAYADAGGPVTWFGKPHSPIYERCYEVIAEQTGKPADKSRILAIGDGIKTDVPGGLAAGLDTLFVTGGLSSGELGPDPETPDPDLLPDYLAAHALAPHYAIGRLR
ncbi:MAG: TIGR01459 family HAD-type hydrolase [Pseudomonadota bacterium]